MRSRAAQQAINSPLLEDITIQGAKGILMNITSGANLRLHEVEEAASLIQEAADEDCNIIFGAVVDENMGEALRITVIATGFDQHQPAEDELGNAIMNHANKRRQSQVNISPALAAFQGRGAGMQAGRNTQVQVPAAPQTPAPGRGYAPQAQAPRVQNPLLGNHGSQGGYTQPQAPAQPQVPVQNNAAPAGPWPGGNEAGSGDPHEVPAFLRRRDIDSKGYGR